MENKNSDISFLSDIYNKYMDIASASEKKGNFIVANKHYYLAANTLIKIIENTPDGSLKDARVKKAKSIIAHADSLPKSNNVVYKTNKGASQQEDEEGGKQWESAQIPNIHFEDVIGLEDVKEEIRVKMINPIKYPEKYKYYNKKAGGGVILYGPPGTGKTMIAKAIACEVGAKFYAIKSSDIVSKWVGDSEKNIASLFEEANKQERAIIFIDEMDSLFKKRGEDPNNDKRVNEFLQQIDGFASKNENLLVLGATNRPWDIDDAAKRSGRFSEKIYIHLPDKVAREGLFRLYLKNAPLSADVFISELADMTNGFSGADIMEVAEKAKERPLSVYISTDRPEPITRKDLFEAIRHVGLGIDCGDVGEYERYANKNGGMFVNRVVAPSPVEPAPRPQVVEAPRVIVEPVKEALDIEFLEKEFNFVPGQSYSLEFYCSKDYPQLFVKIDSKNLACTRKIHNYQTSKFSVDNPGDYKVSILDGDGKVVKDDIVIKFLPPLVEDDMGL